MRSVDSSMTTICWPSSSKDLPSNSPVRPNPVISRNGSRSRATFRVNRCNASASRNARSCSKVSSEPIAYAHPMTVR